MLTVACVYVEGPYPYRAEYVIRLERMVRRYLTRPFHFVCLADQTTAAELLALKIRGEAEIDLITMIPTLAPYVPYNGGGYWNKVHLFNPEIFGSGRILYLDLDTLIVASLDPIADYPAPFALTEDALVKERAHLNRDRYERELVRQFNSSVMVWNAGEAADIWQKWTPATAQQYSTDQDWIAKLHPEAASMPLAWFPRISQVQPPWPSDAKVVLVKKPKNHEAEKRWPWFGELWG